MRVRCAVYVRQCEVLLQLKRTNPEREMLTQFAACCFEQLLAVGWLLLSCLTATNS